LTHTADVHVFIDHDVLTVSKSSNCRGSEFMHPLSAHVLLRLISIEHQLLVRVQYRATAVEPRIKDLTGRDTNG